jgi:hypothetical protein
MPHIGVGGSAGKKRHSRSISVVQCCLAGIVSCTACLFSVSSCSTGLLGLFMYREHMPRAICTMLAADV